MKIDMRIEFKVRPRLNLNNYKSIQEKTDRSGSEDRQGFVSATNTQKAKAIERWWYTDGGDYFVEWATEHYRTHKGTPLKWDEPFYRAFAWAIGHPWFVRIVAIKGAQMGWTEILVALCAFCTAEMRSSAMFCVDEKGKLTDIVAPRVQPSFDAIEPIQKLRESALKQLKRKDIDSQQRNVAVGGVLLSFAFAGKAGGSGQGRQVSSSLSSVPVDLLIVGDEVEGFPLGAINILRERTSASSMPTCPMRFGSTPGGEGGVVDVEVKNARHSFEWWVICPECNEGQFLKTRGSLFKPILLEGSSELRYFDAVGNPLEWFCHDNTNSQTKRNTAYLGCCHCAGELTKEVINNGSYRCEHTGADLFEVGNKALQTKTPIKDNVAIRIPRLASRLFNLHDRLNQLLDSRSIADRTDALQQGFGEVTSFGGGKIDKGLLISAIGKTLPFNNLTPDFITIGADQGLGQHWAVIQLWYLGEGEDYGKRWANANVVVPWAGPVHKFAGLVELATQWKADFIGIDMNPECAAAGEFATIYRPERSAGLQTVISLPRSREAREKITADNSNYFEESGLVLLFYQTELKGEQFRRTKREVQGEEIASIALDRTFGLDAVCDIVHQRRLFLPGDWSYNPRDRDSFLFQMLTSERGPDARWKEVPGAPDHFFHAMNFGACAALAWKFEPQPPAFSFASVRRKNKNNEEYF